MISEESGCLDASKLRIPGYRSWKDVPADVIVDAAIENDAKVIGLSALMTTTMMKMVDVVDW